MFRYFSIAGISIITLCLVSGSIAKAAGNVDSASVMSALQSASESQRQKKKDEDNEKKLESLHVTGECTVNLGAAPEPCFRVALGIRDSMGNQVLQFMTRDDGTFDFHLPDAKIYSLIPLSKSYIVNGNDEVKGGDRIKIQLKTRSHK